VTAHGTDRLLALRIPKRYRKGGFENRSVYTYPLAMEVPATVRLEPLQPRYTPDVEHTLERMMPPGVAPLKLFRTIAHNPQLLDKLRSTGAYLLNFGTLPAADREIVIDRVCARCGCEYEWGVHAALFGGAVGLSEEQLAATVHGSASDPVWSERQALLIELVDQLHDTAGVSDEAWARLQATYSKPQLVELVTLAGQYHAVSFVANAFGVELEEAAARFPA
jgi:4-carboxymuconolactone decarboxylase